MNEFDLLIEENVCVPLSEGDLVYLVDKYTLRLANDGKAITFMATGGSGDALLYHNLSRYNLSFFDEYGEAGRLAIFKTKQQALSFIKSGGCKIKSFPPTVLLF